MPLFLRGPASSVSGSSVFDLRFPGLRFPHVVNEILHKINILVSRVSAIKWCLPLVSPNINKIRLTFSLLKTY